MGVPKAALEKSASRLTTSVSLEPEDLPRPTRTCVQLCSESMQGCRDTSLPCK